MNKMAKDLRNYLIPLMASTLIAISASKFLRAPEVDKARVFSEEGLPSVMRTYKNGRDGLLVQDKSSGDYVPLVRYLEGMNNSGERKIMEERIKTSADWYK